MAREQNKQQLDWDTHELDRTLSSAEPAYVLSMTSAIDAETVQVEDESACRVLQLRALALARCGNYRSARALLLALHAKGATDAETLGLIGRTWKDEALTATDKDQKIAALSEAYRWYRSSYDRHCDSYTGINAAAMAILTGNREEGRRVALEVIALFTESSTKDYWALATLAEAYLIIEEFDKALQYCEWARNQAAGNWANLHTTRQQLQSLALALGLNHDLIQAKLHPPGILLFFDTQCSLETGAGAEHLAIWREELRRYMIANHIEILYGAEQSEVEQICFEVAEELGIERHIFHGLASHSDASFSDPAADPDDYSSWRVRRRRDTTTAYAGIRFAGAALARGLGIGSRVRVLIAKGAADELAESALAQTFALSDLAHEILPRNGGRIYKTMRKGLPSNVSPTDILMKRGKKAKECTICSLIQFGWSPSCSPDIDDFAQTFLEPVAHMCCASSNAPVWRHLGPDTLSLFFNSAHDALCWVEQFYRFQGDAPVPHSVISTYGVRAMLHTGIADYFLDPITCQFIYWGSVWHDAQQFLSSVPEGMICASDSFVAKYRWEGAVDRDFVFFGSHCPDGTKQPECLYSFIQSNK